MVTKAFSLGLAKEDIDDVDKKVMINWVKPHVQQTDAGQSDASLGDDTSLNVSFYVIWLLVRSPATYHSKFIVNLDSIISGPG